MREVERRVAAEIKKSRKRIRGELKVTIRRCELAGIDRGFDYAIEQYGEEFRPLFESIKEEITKKGRRP